ncbi:Oidioi.mRNA.OKI2018_I69.PAR.g9692.t1.cds [Oikopleura dioica]|uniref:Oidioi.mRNA.OKI2018_I69.PAR.g9692.t1.cds n=1 Tax=Oikopleura dioica TaxID=34765 RepID=A0ABN7RPN8_OIKDI|nr:Oidioi.mRNA.OKI2018_I69.PAR.g9692.t1.cds [Oikopleura dioica]
MAAEGQMTGQTMDRLQDKQDPETGEPMRPTFNFWKYELYLDDLKSIAGLVRLSHFALLLIMMIAAVAGGSPGAPFKFQIFLWLAGTAANAFFLVNDFSTSGAPDQLGSFKFTFVRMLAYFLLFLITVITSLAAWGNNGGIGALQAAGAIGTLAGISFGISAFFAYQAHSEYMSAEAEREAEAQKNSDSKTKAEKEAEGPPIDRTTKPNTISGNDFSDLHGQQHMEGDFNTLAHRSQMNSRELDYGERIGYRGQMQYNEPYEGSHPQIMDNPQPLATLSHRNDGLQRGFQQDDMRGDPYGMDMDPYGRDFSTLPRDQTLGVRGGFESHDNTDLQYPQDFQNDAMMLAKHRAGFGDDQ